MRHALGQIRSEKEYFHQLDVDEIDEMRRHGAAKARRLQMAQACQTQDEPILSALERLGYDPDTVRLLHLVPLLHVAWVDGSISRAERECILAIASRRGVEESSPAYRQLIAWLHWPPSEEFFEGTLCSIRAILRLQSAEERRASTETLIHRCREVAFASCGPFEWRNRICIFKRRLIKEIGKRLDFGDQGTTAVVTGA